MNKRIAVLAAGALLLAACGSSGGDSSGTSGSSSAGGGSDTSPYSITFSIDETGSLASILSSFKDGVVGYINQVNADGGIDGHKINMHIQDDRSQPGLASSNMKQAVDEYKSVVQIGPEFPGVLGAAVPLESKYKLPLVVVSGTKDTVSNPYVYQVDLAAYQSPVGQADAISKVFTGSGTPKVATMTFSNPSGEDWASTLKNQQSAKGFDIVTAQTAPENTTDVSAQVDKVLAAKPDVILIALTGPATTLFMKGVRARNTSVPVINWAFGSDSALITSLKDPKYYAVRALGYVTDTTPGMQKYNAAMKASKLDPAGANSLDGALSAAVVVDALGKCGSGCTSGKMQTILSTLNYDSQGIATEPVKFTSTQHLGTTQGDLFGYSNGKVIKVAGPISFG